MRNLLTMVILTTAFVGVVLADTFNEYGVWKAVSAGALLAGRYSIVGPVIVQNKGDVLNVGVYGVSVGDSLKFTLKLYGGFSYALSDSVKFQLLKSSGIVRQVSTSRIYSMADTLEAESQYPYIYLSLQNNHADSSATFDVNVFARERDKTIIRVR